MKIVKPQKLSLLTRPFMQERHPFLSVAALSLHQFDGAMLTEAELWRFVGEALGAQGVPDSGMVKSRAEVLVCGSAMPAGGVAQTQMDVSVRLGEVSRSLRVFGDRYWDRDDLMEGPEPFTKMPLSWERSFGGPSFAANPMGRGHAAAKGEQAPLPNIEDPSQLIRGRTDSPDPAGLGAVDVSWPLRQRKAGTYDDEWLRSQYPGHALDMDWSFYNLASEEQQFARSALEGTEDFELRGMNAETPVQRGQLPPLRARVFIDTATDGDWQLKEVEMGLTTVWLFPNSERLLLVWHGAAPIATDDGTDVRALMIGAEDLHQPRPLEHYLDVFAARTNGETAIVAALDDSGLLPVAELFHAATDPAANEMETLLAIEGHQAARAERLKAKQRAAMRQQLVDDGVDPDEYMLPEESPPEVPSDLGELLKFAKDQQREAEEKAEAAKLEAQVRHAAVVEEFEAAGMDSSMLVDPTAPIVGPPAKPPGCEESNQEALEAAKSFGPAGAQLVEYLESESAQNAEKAIEDASREGYRQTAHLQGVLPSLEGERARASREAAAVAADSGPVLQRSDFTAADLSGLDFSGADLTESWFESADLSGADLSGCKLKGAVLTRANLSGAKLRGADLSGANLGGAKLAGAVLDGATLDGVVLDGAEFGGTSLRGARLSNLFVRDTEFRDVDLSESHLEGVTLMDVTCIGLIAERAELLKVTFLQSQLPASVFLGAKLDRVAFVQVSAEGAKFDEATFGIVCFLMDAQLAGVSFAGAQFEAAGLREANLSGANFNGARFEAVDLSFANLSDARAERASFREALLHRTNLAGASLRGADFAGALLQKADLRGAALDDVNFYAADLAQVRRDAVTSDFGANYERARLVPEWSPLPPVPSHLPWRHA